MSTVRETDPTLTYTDSLWHAFARGVRDNIVAEIAVQVLRVGGMVALARELAPADFGLLKVLLIVSMFAALLCESGIPDALIQRKVLTSEHEVTAWWLSLGLVAATVVALYLSAPVIASAMSMPALSFGIRLICLPMFLEGTAIVPVARLSRELKFGMLAIADVIGELAFLATAFIVLWRGQPQWSLAAGLGARFAAHAIAVWMAQRRMPVGVPRLAAARDLSRFAASVLGGRIVTVAAGNADFLLVGGLLGSRALGFYSMAWDLLRFVPDRLHRVAGRVAFPAFCKLQDSNAQLGHVYLNFIGYIARVVLPIAGCVAIAAPELIVNIYGPQWRPAATPMRLLAFGLALVGLRLGIGATYYARNFPSMDIFLNGARLLLIVAAVVSTARFGLIGVSASVSGVEAFISIAGQLVVCVLVELELKKVVEAALPGLRVALVCMLATLAGRTMGKLALIHGPLVLLFAAIPAVLCFLWLEGDDAARIAANAFGRSLTRVREIQLD
jgi:O-antigen/teichoic acid export membrane protein